MRNTRATKQSASSALFYANDLRYTRTAHKALQVFMRVAVWLLLGLSFTSCHMNMMLFEHCNTYACFTPNCVPGEAQKQALKCTLTSACKRYNPDDSSHLPVPWPYEEKACQAMLILFGF